MTKLSIIAAMDEAGGLGYKNQLLCHLPADLKHFKNTTMGKPVIMGSRTFHSIGRALPGRLNIVLSRTLDQVEGVVIARNLEEALTSVKLHSEAMIIGGQDIYQQSIDKVTALYITRIHHTFEADVFFPHIDESQWKLVASVFHQHDSANQYDLTFNKYERVG